ncbi:MAG: hypothetical protein ABH846_02820, partial [Patescibacteria group bacterium]
MVEEEKKETEEKPTESEHIILPTRKKKNLTWLLILITAIVVGGGVAAFAYRSEIKDKFWPSTIDGSKQDVSPDLIPSVGTTSTGTKIVDEGITWINPRVKLADLGLFEGSLNDVGVSYIGADYYKVATTSDGGEIILAITKIEGMGIWDDFHHFMKKAGVYYWLPENSDAVGGDGNYYSRTNSESDSTFIIKSLQLDKTITKGETVLTQDPSASRSDTFVQTTTIGTKIEETKWGDIYLLKGVDIDGSDGDVKVGQYYILRNDGIRILFHPEPDFRNDDGTFNITWSNAIGKNQKFSQIKTSGCGGAGGSFPFIVDTASLSTKIEVGASAKTKVYTVTADSALAEFAYTVYKMDGMEKVSKDTMMADLGLLVLQDGYGNWAAYMNDKYAPAVECGKPVIYLYPEKETNVFVRVGADITKSEPEYNGGWKVLATPAGKLNLAGKIYDSLFWEGTGWGQYPAITSGTVVESSRVATTISSQLSWLGLNSKEIADFKDFWLPKMPATPYTRLTWLLTDEMNTLAPLAVSPKPDS